MWAVLVCVCVACGGGDEPVGLQPGEPDQVAPYDDEPDASAPAVVGSDAAAAPTVEPDASAAPVSSPDAGAPVEPGETVEPVEPVKPAPVATGCALHRDADGDGYGEAATSQVACNLVGHGYVRDGSDCYDGNALAHPGFGTGFELVHRGDGSFDYDCDGVETLWKTAVALPCPEFGALDNRCPPDNPKLYGYSSNDLSPRRDSTGRDCFEDIRDKVAGVVDGGWYGAVPACGERAPTTGLTFTRETGYVCAASGLQPQRCI